jgi:uncharacterized protein (TIGR02466 family)
MNIQYCFPTALFTTIDQNLADKLLPIAKKYLENDEYINVDITIYKTTWFSNAKKYKELNFFAEYVCDLGKQFLAKQGYKTDHLNFSATMFLNEMYNGQDHPAHTHANNDLSGVIFLQVPPGSAPITFYDPKPRRHFIQRENEFLSDSNVSVISMNPEKGLLIMWESWLEHSVEKNQNKDLGRISLVFNLKSERNM